MNIPSAAAATTCLSKAWSITFDSLIGNHISQALEGTFSPYMPFFLATYSDFVTLGLLLVMIGEKGTETGREEWSVEQQLGRERLRCRIRGVNTRRKGDRRGGHTLLFFILGTIDKLGWIILDVRVCPMHCKVFKKSVLGIE